MSLSDKNVPSLSRLLDWANETGDRYHVGEILENYPVIMSDDFAGVRAARSRREYVRNRYYDFNVVIPEYLGAKLDADVEAERRKRQKPTCLVDTDSYHPGDTTKEIIAFFPGSSPKFTSFLVVLLAVSPMRLRVNVISTAVYRMKEFYSVRKSCAAWLADMTWLEETTWGTISATPELFDEETDSDELDSDTAGSKHVKLALEAAKSFG
ncbi:Hypothetical protein PHPALM_17383 [Phytophthora palmivora]|uniref:Uncharacterized protein n=1 Tax=Phytophthora palmivora TaxID=4796 RepID=A0A2P4XMC5_9STRA|nr:Hypothetical protein PHPALM_17383 [Phytophthora palmivora]